ncbi:MAG: DUF2442 domain-containing protein [Desulfuromonadales bacterium]|nr:DUF2442 domain-containing protein [Desulfuromonadales bacterium]
MCLVVRVVPHENYRLEIEFNNGEVRFFDGSPYLNKGIFSQLYDKALFARAFVAYDTVCWPGELDIAPETLYSLSVPENGSATEHSQERR